MTYDIRPIKPALGATVHVDRDTLFEEAFAKHCLDVLEERGVLVFPQINLDDAEQLKFTDRLGARAKLPQKVPGMNTTPGIYKVTLDPKINDQPEYVLGTFFWHMDGMPVENIPPPVASLLSARTLAPKGGQTEFASTAAAYAALPAEEKAEVDNLRVVHTIYHAVQETLDTEEDRVNAWRKSASRERPLVWTQPSGRKSMLIGATADRIVGMGVAEGRALLARLQEWSARPEFHYRHYWSKGDLVIWHNSGILHRVIPYARDSGRVMHRTSLAGTEMMI